MVKKFFLIFTFILFILAVFYLPKNKFAIECNLNVNLTGLSEKELQELINKCTPIINNLRSQISNLSSQIQYMDSQIFLTTAKIKETEDKIIKTKKEIEVLEQRIVGLDESLDYLSKLLLAKIVQGYKIRSISMFTLIIDSNNMSDLISRIKYLKDTQEYNQRLLIQVQQTKLNFEEQKKLREQKNIELAQLNQLLNEQKQSLNLQKIQKQKLLADTQNDENTYQTLLSKARAQLASFKSFVQTSGASSIITANAFGNGSDGAYYSQRDERWANKFIGYSSETILNVGCLITSVSMVLKKNGVNIDPSIIASNPDYFYLNTAYMKYRNQFNPWPGGLNNYQIPISQIDEELSNGRYVIVGVGGCSYGGSHFVVLTKKEGNDYIMHDPIYGPDIKFSAHYSNICSAETFK